MGMMAAAVCDLFVPEA
jgi:hypothetical protein